MLGGSCCVLVFVDLEAHHNFIYDGVGVVESKFDNRSTILSELKVRFLEVVFKVSPICL